MNKFIPQDSLFIRRQLIANNLELVFIPVFLINSLSRLKLIITFKLPVELHSNKSLAPFHENCSASFVLSQPLQLVGVRWTIRTCFLEDYSTIRSPLGISTWVWTFADRSIGIPPKQLVIWPTKIRTPGPSFRITLRKKARTKDELQEPTKLHLLYRSPSTNPFSVNIHSRWLSSLRVRLFLVK